jgi:galactose mutarotase-like enzyme
VELTLKNSHISCQVSNIGAELCSLRRIDRDDEYIWQRDPAIWAGSAPILFPFVGRMKNAGFMHEGEYYLFPIHGFAASAKFQLEANTAESVIFCLRSDKQTKQIYPFDFALTVTFSLFMSTLNVHYTVENLSLGTMYFAIGSHPAFRLPLEDASLNDYFIEFSKPEINECYKLEGDLLGVSPVAHPLRFDRRLDLSPTIFDEDALIFKHIRSRALRLAHRSGTTRLTMHLGSAPHLGIWAKPAAPYVCIEPWHGYDDDADSSEELSKKQSVISLRAGDVFKTDYTVSI